MLKKILLMLCLTMVVSTLWAYDGGSLGAISQNLMGPMRVLTKIVFFISIVCGIGFFLGAIIQYKFHRENPQQVRLSTPVVMLLLSIGFIGFPLALVYSGFVPGWG